MRRLGIALVTVGIFGFLVVTIRFAEAYQPMWVRAVKRLPDKPSYTHNEVASAVLEHIQATRSTLYLGVGFSVFQVAGVVLVCKAKGRSDATTSS